MYKKNYKNWAKHLDFILIDIISMYLAYGGAYWIKFHNFTEEYSVDVYKTIMVALLMINLLVSIAFSSFNGVLKRGHFREMLETVKHVLLVIGILMLYLFLTQREDGYYGYSRFVIFVMMGLYAFFGYCFRMLYKMARRKHIRENRSFLVITTKAKIETVLEGLAKAANNGVRVNSLCIVDSDEEGNTIKDIKVVANKDNVAEYICREWIDEVFVTVPPEDKDGEAKKLIHDLIKMGVTVHLDLSGYAEFLGQSYAIENIGTFTSITTSINFVTPAKMFIKRLMDIVGGLIGSIFTIFLTIVLAPFILIKSPGPLFFKQERIGRNGKHFKMLKFRSMRMDAEALKKDLMAQNRVGDGMMFKLDWDPRIIGNRELPDGTRKTGIGEFIRKTSLDEFPQFFNVLKGDMSLVGTRPPTLDEWEKYKLHHRARLAVKPGITGMWQANGRSEITNFEEVVKLDTEYITNWSLRLDIKIIFKTFAAVLLHKGAM